MTHEINIYGDIVPFKWFKDGSEFDRADLNNLIDALNLQEGDELIYNLNTFGGCTTTAFAMYNKLKRVQKEKNITLTSRADGYCASSGVILLLAADKKIGSKYLKPFVHNAWTFAMGDKNEMQKVYEDLAVVDNAIAELYAEETSIEKDTALQLMNESRELTVDECLKYGFYTELENVKVVETEDVFNSLKIQNSIKRQNFNNDMTEKNEAKKKDLWKQIENFFKGTKNKIVFTAENFELDFYELGDEDIPAIGDKAKYDGKPAGESNDGEYVMASGETYKFTGEELTEIVPKEEETSEVEDLKSENADMKTEIANLKTKISGLENKITDATAIIENFKSLESEDEDEGKGERNPKEKNTKRNLFKNLK